MNRKPRLLVVDDEAAQLQALCTVLREEGHEVQGCATPESALQALREGRFDVMLSDLNMPQMDGIALMKQALHLDPDLVPVLMTGQGTVATAVEAMKVGALDYVLKPFRLSAIRPVLDRAAEVHRLRARNRLLQEDVERRTNQLEAANRELDAFAARIAHDLRGPLLAMLGFARVLQERDSERLDAQSQGYLQRIVSAGERAERMVVDLLAFARLGEAALRRETVDLNEVLRQARTLVEPQAPGHALQWRIGRLPLVRGDAPLLEMVFANLLSNAIKYSRMRDPAVIEVHGRSDPTEGHVVKVRDNGIGFDPAYATRLFTPFQRLHSAEQFEGHGIGLAHVKRIVERHGGTVAATSEPGQGATFTVTLPA
jgi:signal transduction histidine kinase